MGLIHIPQFPSHETPLSLAYVEDNPATLDMNLSLFRIGLNPTVSGEELVRCRGFDSYDELMREAKNGEFPHILVTDNEVYGSYGVDEAPRMYDMALAAGHEMVTVSLLASNLAFITRDKRQRLMQRGIPMFDKTTQSVLCARFIGRCVQEGRMLYDEFAQREGVPMISFPIEKSFQAVQNSLLPAMWDDTMEPGAWYLTLPQFLEHYREVLLRYMSRNEGERTINMLLSDFKQPPLDLSRK